MQRAGARQWPWRLDRPGALSLCHGMEKETGRRKPALETAKSSYKAARMAREAAALRANLRKRKEQARERSATDVPAKSK